MLASQNVQPGIGDIMANTSHAKWYDDVESCLNDNEVIPGTYAYTTATSYGNVGSFTEGASTKFDIQANIYNVISLENSYITLELDVPITIPTQANSKFQNWYVGFLMSAACFGEYRFFSETNPIDHQNIKHAHYEWFIIWNSFGDEAKENNPALVSLKKIREMNPNVPGVYINTSAITGNTPITVKIPLKIPLCQFLMLQNLKWLPHWMGKLTLDAFTSYRNLIIVPVIPESTFNTFPIIQSSMDTANIAAWNNNDANANTLIDFGFHQLNMPMKNRIHNNLAHDTCNFLDAQTWSCNTQTTNFCQIRLATYQLKAEITMALAARYAEEPLLFPMQIFEAKDFTTPIGTGAQSIDTAMTVWLKNCDSAYFIFKEHGIYSTQRFTNPFIRFSVNINGQIYPREEYESIDDLRTLNMTLDALNINNSSITSMSTDLRTSLQEYTRIQSFAANGNRTNTISYTTGTRSNFMIGMPFADSEIFHGGITTPSTVQIQMKGQRIRGGEAGHVAIPKIHNYNFAQPVAIFIQDAVLRIQSVALIGKSKFEIDLRSLDQIRRY